MKGKFVWILGTIETIIGFALFWSAQMEISSNARYTWRRPYTSYEAQVIMIKWIGIILLASGIIWLCLKMFQLKYTNTHTQEITPVIEKGGIITCPNCGLTLSADVENCPRCGSTTKTKKSLNTTEKNVVHFCSNCGAKVNLTEVFCSNCGQKISK